ncbi:phosphatase PAP2 family protein [Luteimicrobium subarcticum]|uniref:Undecaprenyl-diphosphatase n=1 Tax=Luteimicrobium subarcticum TaxID=620910 RepID=A0A2M8W6U1_9MICO|nr:phosphatase PAP2 family protein [Luteimicrobium subarcticum]PJI86629.1 undecaprenyl-diphosphatase [Luteimicrobium subarcticum]
MHRHRRHALLRAAGFGLLFAAPVAVLAYLVRAQSDVVVERDKKVIRAATDWTREHPAAHDALLVWQEVFNVRWVVLGGVVVCVAVWRRYGMRSRALWALGTILVAWGVQIGLKTLVGRARPVVEDAVAHAPGSSFPSGHTTQMTATAVTLTLLVWPLLGPRGRVIVPVAAGTLIVLTGADRVLLGVHYPSDVVAGVLVGGALAGASYLGWSGWNPLPDHSAEPAEPADPAAHRGAP